MRMEMEGLPVPVSLIISVIQMLLQNDWNVKHLSGNGSGPAVRMRDFQTIGQ